MNKFIISEPEQNVFIHLPDGTSIKGPRGAALEEFLKALIESPSPPIVGAVINDQLRELTFPIQMESKVRPVTMGEADGMRFYRRSLTFLLEAAFYDLFPDYQLSVDHSVSSGGYFCQVIGREPLSVEELDSVENRMKSLVAADLRFERKEVPLNEAIEYFDNHGHDDKVKLLKHRTKQHLVLYSLGEHRDYHHGYMVPSTGYIKLFGLSRTGDGFTLRFPRRFKPTELLPLPDYSTLLQTFRQYGDWLQNLGIDSVGALNETISSGKIQEAILISEALHEQHISNIATRIADKSQNIRIVLIAGPSSSGKTTFSKRLTIQLLTRGISPFPLEMDNYFVDRVNTPKDEHGNLDFESIQALDREKLSEDLAALINGKTVQMPKYNFRTGESSPGEIVKLQSDQIIILEGIHGLNPELIPEIPTKIIFRIYTSALTQLNLDRHNRVSTTDTRLIRRIVRDSRDRGYSALETINRWESVRRGEKRYIFPYQENADMMFNSALFYELSALKPLAEPIIRQVPYGTSAHIEAKRLLTFLDWFLPIERNLIPENSIIQEFLGQSSLKGFKIWR